MAIQKYLKDLRILSLIAFIAVLAILDYAHGINLGIEFVGGTQIPIQLEHSVTPDQMNQLISILQQRLSTFGLKQVPVTGVGSSQVLVETASVSQSEIQSLIGIIQSQGIFQGIVSGKEAINGSSLLEGSIGSGQPVVSGTVVEWSVNFYLTQKAAIYFSKVVFGQGNRPLYMFLDRPAGSILLINSSVLTGTGPLVNQESAITAAHDAALFGNRTIPIEMLSNDGGNWKSLYPFFKGNSGKYQKVILAYGTPAAIIANLTQLNYTIVYKNASDLSPRFIQPYNYSFNNTVLVDSWPAIGLLSAPILSTGVTNGSISQGYIISGSAPPNLSAAEAVAYANNQTKEIVSILRGGALPVHVIVEAPTTTPPTLGTRFEAISAIALLLAVIAVSLVIVMRYRKLFLIAPIMLTTLAELFIMLSIVGLIGTIDLSAIAGMIAVIGTGVDAQIIITDEVLVRRGDASTMKMKLGNAFYIVWADALLLVVAMLPLFFETSLVSVTGFSVATITGALLGAFVTRPTYGAMLSKHYADAV
ncbi:MAG: hypothetical protein KGI00_01500 [Candidatus Micrarchaeota archaeon]|nr:hypothetical protein [Candidatus Micrarchaeota archaeon]MDE1849384.1 hypothetical protein [Candidatus Micrarchaeota archaeon]